MPSLGLGSLVDSRFDFGSALPNFVGQSDGLIDPRSRRRTPGNLEPGQDLEIRGFNEFQDERRRQSRLLDSLEGISSQRGLSQALTRSTAEAGRAADSEAGSLRRRQQGLGLQLSDRQRRVQNRRLGLRRALSEASAAGATRRTFSENAKAARRGASGLEGDLFDIENAGLLQLANAASQNKINAENMIAKREEDRSSFLGGIAGIAASFFSEESFKHDKEPATGLLEKLKKLRIDKWKYKGDDHTDHIGPYAQEFNDAFGVGQDNKQQISIIDALGVTMGAVKELSERVNG